MPQAISSQCSNPFSVLKLNSTEHPSSTNRPERTENKPMQELPNCVCIIGAGSSGIAACKVLKDHGIPFDCYEAGDRVGGNWVFENIVETSRVSAMTYLAVRRGFHVIPKYIMGKPLDQLPAPGFLPFAWQLKIYG